MKISFIIAARSVNEAEAAISSIFSLKSNSKNYEILVAIGNSPSLQRNAAAAQASGDYLFFLDNDSRADPKLLDYFFDALSYESEIGVVGGPSIYEAQGSLLKTSIQGVFSSVFGLGPFRSRYMSTGRVRRSDEHELILCNLAISRTLFIQQNGFNTQLYPNEENEFLNRIRHLTKIYYHPLMICYRDPRSNLPDYLKQMIRYGRGRAKSLRMFPRFWNNIFFLPLAFSLYFLSVPIIIAVEPTLKLFDYIYLTPLLIYVTFCLSASTFIVMSFNNLKMYLSVPLLFFFCHFFYGLGMLSEFLPLRFGRDQQEKPIQVIEIAWNTLISKKDDIKWKETLSKNHLQVSTSHRL